jgi:hypothetical protein
VPPTAPKGPATRKPVTPGIRRLSNHEPEATSTAKSSESPIMEIVISRNAPAKTTKDLLQL